MAQLYFVDWIHRFLLNRVTAWDKVSILAASQAHPFSIQSVLWNETDPSYLLPNLRTHGTVPPFPVCPHGVHMGRFTLRSDAAAMLYASVWEICVSAIC